MARKTNKNSLRNSNSKGTSKAAFVRNLPSDMPAAQVIAKAQANGIKLSPAYVYVIRSKSSAKPNGKVTARTNGGGMRGGGSNERQFVDLALQLGFSRAQQLLDTTRASIQRVVLS
jgi:hypothetical protein